MRESDNESPKAPEGFNTGASQAGLPKRNERKLDSFRLALIWLIVGSFLTFVSTGLAGVALSFAFVHLRKEKPVIWQIAAALLSLVISLILAWDLSLVALPQLVVVIAGSFLCVHLYLSNRLSWKSLIVLGLLFAGIQVAGDALLAWKDNSDIATQIASFADQYVSALSQTSSAGASLDLTAAADFMKAYWPLSYVLSSYVSLFLCYLGMKLGLKSAKQTFKPLDASNIRFGVIPALLFVASATAQIVGPGLANYSEQLVFLANNAFVIVRGLEFIAGFSLVVAYSKRKNWPKFLLGILLVVGLYIEISFFIVSALGLVDVVANFRRFMPDMGEHRG